MVVGFEHFLFFHILGRIIPTDFHIFRRVWNHQPDIYIYNVVGYQISFNLIHAYILIIFFFVKITEKNRMVKFKHMVGDIPMIFPLIHAFFCTIWRYSLFEDEHMSLNRNPFHPIPLKRLSSHQTRLAGKISKLTEWWVFQKVTFDCRSVINILQIVYIYILYLIIYIYTFD